MNNKRGQFYLISAMIIIAIALGFVAISNTSGRQGFAELSFAGEELEFESQAVLDYIAYKDQDAKAQLTTFTQDYSTYTDIDNSYFVFGDTTEVTVAAYQKFSDGRILVDTGSGDQELEIEKATYKSQSYSSPTSPVTLTINEVEHEFELKQGTNFYFIIAKAKKEGEYVFTGG